MKKKLLAGLAAVLIALGSLSIVEAAKPLVIQEQGSNTLGGTYKERPGKCRVENLEWVTPKENIQHAYRTGLAKSGPNHSRSLLTAEQVRYIRRVYKKRDPEFGMGALGRKFGVHIGVIHGVIHRKTYKNID